MKRLWRIIMFSCVAVVMTMTTSCGLIDMDFGTVIQVPYTMRLNPDTAYVMEGDTFVIAPMFIPDSVSNREVYYSSEAAMAVDTDPHRSAEYIETRETLAKALDELTEKEKLVVSLYYYDELTMKEISLIMHLSEARICQLHTKAMFKLRGFLANIDGI